jgi:NAD-dependent SIR2 family protein deacetylase
MAGKIFGEHGVTSLATDDCTVQNVVDLDEVVIPRCDVAACGGIVKPDITFFGESLPERYASNVGPDTKDADALIVVGTSLKASRITLTSVVLS